MNLFIIDMARTRRTFVPRGESFSHDEASKHEPKRRSMTSARRRGKVRHGDVGSSATLGEIGPSSTHGQVGPSSTTLADIHEE